MVVSFLLRLPLSKLIFKTRSLTFGKSTNIHTSGKRRRKPNLKIEFLDSSGSTSQDNLRSLFEQRAVWRSAVTKKANVRNEDKSRGLDQAHKTLWIPTSQDFIFPVLICPLKRLKKGKAVIPNAIYKHTGIFSSCTQPIDTITKMFTVCQEMSSLGLWSYRFFNRENRTQVNT